MCLLPHFIKVSCRDTLIHRFTAREYNNVYKGKELATYCYAFRKFLEINTTNDAIAEGEVNIMNGKQPKKCLKLPRAVL